MIKTDLRDLAQQEQPSHPPANEALYAPMLARAWMNTVDTSEKAFAIEGTRIRNSWAASCARKMSYEIRGDAPSNPFDEASYHTFGIGTALHEKWQAVLLDAFPNADIEVDLDMRPHGLDASGHLDMGLPDVDGKRVAMELKTTGGFAFKLAVGERGAAEGPRWSAIVQGALNALAYDADEMRIVLLSLECISQKKAEQLWDGEPWRRFSAEWVFTRDEYEPIARLEIKRMNKILGFIDAGGLAPRQIPDPLIPAQARIVDPAKGMWEHIQDGMILNAGTWWGCGYCSQRERCIQDGATDES